MPASIRTTLLVDEADYAIEQAHARLVREIRDLAEKLTRVGDRLEQEGLAARAPEGGIVQKGAEVDLACAALNEARRAKAALLAALAAARAEAGEAVG